MGLFSFLFRTHQPAAKQPVPALAPDAQPTKAAPVLSVVARPPTLRREEVIDRKSRLYGYRFSLTESRGATALFSALTAERIDEFASRRLAVIPLTLPAVASHLRRQFAAQHTVFVLDAADLQGPQAVALLNDLKLDGARSGIRGMPTGADQAALLDACDVLFLDFGDVDLPHLHSMLDQLRANHTRLKVAVEGVNTWEEQRMCIAWGADYCLGGFMSQPDRADEEGSLDQSRLTALKLLNLLRSDAELAQLTEVAKQDPAITFQLLKWANSPMNGHGSAVTGLGQAMMVLGRNLLYRWLAVSIFKLGRQRERDAALLEIALRRARFLELLNPALTAAERDELFLVGLLSLFDVMFGIPMPRLLDHMTLSPATQDVLLRSEGKYAPYLRLAIMVERGDGAHTPALAAAIGIDPAEIGQVQAEAFAWTQESLLQEAA
jgi:EAL and modified HD-GYP domain-containing signal transduction protein